MSRITKGAERALRRGGVSELVWVIRKHLAAKIEPTPRSQVKSVPRTPLKPVPRAATMVTPKLSSARDVDHAEAVKWFEARRPTYERLANAIAPYVDRQGVVLDVGANIGYFTKVFGEVLEFDGTVHLFEPIPHLAELCRATLRDVPFRTMVHEFGLSDEDAELNIFLSSDGNLGWNTIVEARASTGMRPLPIQVRAFDRCGVEAIPSFVKIDVEGAEYKVLRGMLGAIERWSPRPAILCEIGWGSGHPAWDDELRIFHELKKLGYRTLDLNKQPIDVESLRKTTDLLFIPEHLV